MQESYRELLAQSSSYDGGSGGGGGDAGGRTPFARFQATLRQVSPTEGLRCDRRVGAALAAMLPCCQGGRRCCRGRARAGDGGACVTVLVLRRLQFNALRQLGQTTRQREQEMRDHIREARRQSLLVDQVGFFRCTY